MVLSSKTWRRYSFYPWHLYFLHNGRMMFQNIWVCVIMILIILKKNCNYKIISHIWRKDEAVKFRKLDKRRKFFTLTWQTIFRLHAGSSSKKNIMARKKTINTWNSMDLFKFWICKIGRMVCEHTEKQEAKMRDRKGRWGDIERSEEVIVKEKWKRRRGDIDRNKEAKQKKNEEARQKEARRSK